MHIKDGICYADGNLKEIKVTECKPCVGEMLLLTFSNGEKKLFDCTTLKGSAFLPLMDEAVFNDVKLNHGFPTWDNGNIDIAPEVLYEQGIPYNESDIISC